MLLWPVNGGVEEVGTRDQPTQLAQASPSGQSLI